MSRFVRLLIVSCALFFAATAINAQTTGLLSGTVTDPNGAVVSSASVTIKNNQTGESRTITANSEGKFTFASISPGVYTVTIEAKGFTKTVANDVTISVANESQLAITLQVGGANETVTVTDTQEVINSSSPTLTNVINTKQVQDLPLSARNPLDLAALQAGIAVTGTGTRTSSVSGLRGSATNVTQDGINAMDNFVKTDSFFALSAPSLNSTSEFSITTGTTGSDAGRGVAQVNLVTKGGSNEFHGNIFYLTRNSAFNSNNFYNNQNGTPRPDLHQHYYGFSIGGPVYFLKFGEGGKTIWDGHNKAFFFFTYEGFREKFQTTVNRTVLTPEARTGTFRYTGTDGLLKTVNLLTVGTQTQINALTSAVLNKMPTPNNTLIGDGFNTAGARFNIVGSDPSDKYVARYDHQLVENSRLGSHKFEFVYNRAEFSLFPDTFNGIQAPFPGGVDAGQSSIRSLFTGALTSVFGNASNVFRYGRQWAPVGFIRQSAPTAPFVTFSSVTTYDNTFMSQGRNTNVNEISDNFSLPKGKHFFRFGGDWQNVYAYTFNDAGINPTIGLGTNSANPDGILAASFPNSTTTIVNRARAIYADLVGNLASASATFNVSSPSSGFVLGATRERIFQQKDLALYFQDQWRVFNNLNLTAGVRWEYEGVPTIPNGLAIQTSVNSVYGISGVGNLFNPTAPIGQPAGIASLNFVSGSTGKKLYNEDLNNYAPFIGIAYSPSSKNMILKYLFGEEQGRSSIRAGYSISYLHDGFTVISNAMGTGTTNPGLIQTAANTTPTGVLTTAGVPLTTPTFTIPITDRQNFDINPGNGLWAIEPNLRIPYVQQWNIGFEREIARNTAIEFRYVGNHAIKVWRAYDINEVNIFENGFLQEFKNAQTNLNLRGGANFAPGCVGCLATPTLDKLFTGLAASSGYSSSGFISNLTGNNVGSMASTLAFSNTYKTNRNTLLPANFFVANPNAAFARILGNDSMSNYHALQLEFRRRFSQGLQFQSSYTYSKSLTDATDAAGSQSDLVSWRTLRNKHLDYRRSNQDQTHRFVSNVIYDLPFGKGKSYLSSSNGVINNLVGNWTVSSIVTWQGRPPFYIAASRATFNSFNAGNNPAQLLGMTFDQFKANVGLYRRPEGMYFINPAILDITTNPTTGKFVSSTLKAGNLGSPAPGTFGNFPLNSINGPTYFNWDMAITKRFKVKERVGLELKTTFINVLNHANFAFGSQSFDSASFGLITGTSGNDRIIHFTGTMSF
ncbi:MAG: TonB-dependent receptor [Pyrinomonadaceae bacterium]|nr:TonB-dependent receptor [Pyrinomonadaceae bacterium]